MDRETERSEEIANENKTDAAKKGSRDEIIT